MEEREYLTLGIKERRINKLIALFNEREVLTVEEIKEELEINDRSVKSYIGFLREYGIEIIPMNKRYKAIKEEKLKGNLINKQELRMMKIMLTVSENSGCFDRKSLVDNISKSLFDEESVSRKTIERAIKSCEEKRYIYLDENNKYRTSIVTDSFYFTNDEDIFKFIELCEIYKVSMPFYKEVNNLKNKIVTQLDYEDPSYNIYCIGRKYSEEAISKDIIRQFESLNYRKKAITISYNSKIGELTESIQVVTFLYNWEKDKSYVIGLVKDKLYFIDVKTIISIVPSDLENEFFNHKETLDKLDLMFGASLDEFYEVKVEFVNTFNIKEKVTRLHKHRKSSNLIEDGDKLIYSDKLYGIYDFARYLRSFGSYCKVLEPVELKEIMRKTYEKILLNYGEIKNE
ncbi:WYL domain-containing transcriptional regulator [Clostridium sp. YIM B02551]|uniref:WYL domain-containing transcriptional regulator n=1 Tax=Clostridium sp. YIM B02551 TaxID=2910679 RepID=UPI001EEB2628|nr:WYL domain-containing transcriptional regulator [Clostridium sp. YIM B02551]